MDNESEIVRLLAEIRDNQQRQLDAHQNSNQEYRKFYGAAQAKQNLRVLIIVITFGVGAALLFVASR